MSFAPPSFPVSFSALKQRCREGLAGRVERQVGPPVRSRSMTLCSPLRQYWWPVLVKQPCKAAVDAYPDVVESAASKLEAAADLAMDKVASSGGFKYLTLEDSFFVFTTLYDVQEPELLRPLSKLIASELEGNKDRVAIAFAMYGDLFNNNDKFSKFDALSHRCRLFAFRKALKINMPRTFSTLNNVRALEDRYLDLIFVEFFGPLLRPEHIARVLDCYFNEGVKILFRFGLGFFKAYKHSIKSGQFKSGEDFWDFARSNSDSAPFMEMVEGAFERKVSVVDKVVRTSRFVLSMANLRQYMSEGKSSLGESGSEPLRLSSVDPRTANTDAMVRCSTLLSRDEAVMLVEALPEAVKNSGFDLKYATHRDGWSLDTLYAKVGTYYPCIILIRALKSDAVFGAYLSAPLSPPSKASRGDGSCFVFRLNGNKPRVYRWALEGHNLSKKQMEEPTLHQFAVCSTEFIMFGGDAAHGTNAIYLDQDLKTCVSGRSDTYDNPSLVPEIKGSVQVKDVEVLCGRGRINLVEQSRREQVISRGSRSSN